MIDASKFKFWCQKVLPLVYDDSLSYYEVVCKLGNAMKELGELVNEELDEFRDDIGTFKEVVQAEITRFEEELRSGFETLEGEFNTLQDNFEIVSGQFDGVKQQFVELTNLVNTFADSIERNQNEINDIQFLGWAVPKEMPIKNYVDGSGKFHQWVGRVDLGSLSWGGTFWAQLPEAKNSGACYCSKYVSTTLLYYELQNKQMTLNSNELSNTQHIIIKDNDYTDATAFRSAMSGTYLYYELATEIVIAVGNEQIPKKQDKVWNYIHTFTSTGTFNVDTRQYSEILVGLENQYNQYVTTQIIPANIRKTTSVAGIAYDDPNYSLFASITISDNGITCGALDAKNWIMHGADIYAR